MKKIIFGTLISVVCSYSVNCSMPWDSLSDQLRTDITHEVEATWTGFIQLPATNFHLEMTEDCRKIYEEYKTIKREAHTVELDLIGDFINIFLRNQKKIKRCKFGTFNNFICEQFKLMFPAEEVIGSDTIDLYISALISLKQITPDKNSPYSYLLVKGSLLEKEYRRYSRTNKNTIEPNEDLALTKRVRSKIKKKKYNDD